MDDLYDRDESARFYEQRYAHSYMEDWPAEKKRRIAEVVQALPLPASGRALDFGCGNGVFTEVLRQALPSWRVVGTDFSGKALENAAARYPGCRFLAASSLPRDEFDLVFTHHVLEHVFDLDSVFAELSACMKRAASMLHVLPCGNPGSLEHQVCLLRSDGIDKERGNRFFFEDEGHVRRLTTDDLAGLARRLGFRLESEFYANQSDGAIEWITRSGRRFVSKFADAAMARDAAAKRQLDRLRWRLTVLAVARRLSRRIDRAWKDKAEAEWRSRRHERGGSEMYLYFRRG